jgi:hypothetical protein
MLGPSEPVWTIAAVAIVAQTRLMSVFAPDLPGRGWQLAKVLADPPRALWRPAFKEFRRVNGQLHLPALGAALRRQVAAETGTPTATSAT